MSCNALPAIQAGYIEYVPETAQTFPAEQSSGPTCAACLVDNKWTNDKVRSGQ